MKVFLVDDSTIVLEKLAAMISGIDGVDYFFGKVTEIEKIYDTFKQLLKDKS